eukprot:8273411-Alexandrium_andersonii.AAC.1
MSNTTLRSALHAINRFDRLTLTCNEEVIVRRRVALGKVGGRADRRGAIKLPAMLSAGAAGGPHC